MNWKYLKANAKAAVSGIFEDLGIQPVWRKVVAVAVALLAVPLVARLLFGQNRWPEMDTVVIWAITVPATLGVIFAYKLVSVSIQGQIKAEKERDDVKKAISALENERDELRRNVESVNATSGKPQNRVSRRVGDARKTLREMAAAVSGAKTRDDMSAWMRRVQEFVRRAFTPQFASQLTFAFPTGQIILDLRDRFDLQQAAATLEAMALNVKEEHLRG